MILITLGRSVLTNSEIQKLCEKHADLDYELLKNIADCKTMIKKDENENVKTKKMELSEMNEWQTGAEGCRMYLEDHWISDDEYKMLNVIELPCDVYEKCTCREWNDISATLSFIEECSERIMLYCEMGIDNGFIVSEEQVLKMAVEILCGENGYEQYCKKLPNDYGTLKKIGFEGSPPYRGRGFLFQPS